MRHGCWCDKLRMLQEMVAKEFELKNAIRACKVAVLKPILNVPKKSQLQDRILR